MLIAAIILLMILLVAIGRRSKEIGLREYLVIFLITLAQIILVLIFMYTTEVPPLQ